MHIFRLHILTDEGLAAHVRKVDHGTQAINSYRDRLERDGQEFLRLNAEIRQLQEDRNSYHKQASALQNAYSDLEKENTRLNKEIGKLTEMQILLDSLITIKRIVQKVKINLN